MPHWMYTVHHDGSPLYVVGDNLDLGTSVTVRLRTGLEAPVQQVFLRTCPDGEQAMSPMRLVETTAACRWWEAELPLLMPLTHYRFLILTNEGGWQLTAGGPVRHNPTDATDFKILAGYQAPVWVSESIFYQIFPDRFADGDPSNNVRSNEYLSRGRPVIARPWGELPRAQDGGLEFFGGDLPGIIQKLDYLQELGVSALYLNPIFTSPSNHKYDVTDYRQVDPHLGGNPALIALRQALDERGIRLILDIVPNHCGSAHPWFSAAQADSQAKTADFFTFRQHPAEYECWLGVQSLPKLNYRSLALREEMYAGQEAVMRYWLRSPFRIDGWRVDVANMLGRQGETQLGHKIGRGIRRALKAEAPQAYLLGENFYDGTAQLQGDELDGSQNYQGFTFPLLRWLAGFDLGKIRNLPWTDDQPLPTEALTEQLRAYQAAVPWQIANQQFNQLSSHDIPRLLTVVDKDEAKVRLAVGLLFSYPGVPCIYYGDEIGLEGGPDPDNRRCMNWQAETWNTGLREYYRTLIRLRRNSPALHRGGFQWLYASGHTLAFQREAPGDHLIIIARRSNDNLLSLPVIPAGLPDGTPLRELLTGASTTITDGQLPLDSLSATDFQIWQA